MVATDSLAGVHRTTMPPTRVTVTCEECNTIIVELDCNARSLASVVFAERRQHAVKVHGCTLRARRRHSDS